MTYLVDAHAHIWSRQRALRNAQDKGPSRLSREHAIADLWQEQPTPMPIVLIESDRANPQDNEDLLSTALSEPLVAGVVGRLDFDSVNFSDQVQSIIHSDGGRFWRGARIALRRDIEDRWGPSAPAHAAQLGQSRRVLEILTPHDRIDDTIRIAREAECTVVVDHLAMTPWQASDSEFTQWESDFVELSKVENVVTKLSNLPGRSSAAIWRNRVLKAYRLAIDHFGPARLMYASNWPAPAVDEADNYPLKDIIGLTIDLSDSERSAVMGGTAIRSYGLQV